MRTFWKVTFPLILPGILAAALLSFALSIDDFIITLFNAGSLSTFPLYIYGSFRVQFPPQANVLATIILIVSVVLMMVGVLRIGAPRGAPLMRLPRPAVAVGHYSQRNIMSPPDAPRIAVAPESARLDDPRR